MAELNYDKPSLQVKRERLKNSTKKAVEEYSEGGGVAPWDLKEAVLPTITKFATIVTEDYAGSVMALAAKALAEQGQPSFTELREYLPLLLQF